ncbi:MAG: hypothetical protein C0619_07005 [Desulfuromonas sp.]|jgi:hypothetical protein|nr:MAG: hypothetical protein C0619_07005 [Desulfuromonas sp.]
MRIEIYGDGCSRCDALKRKTERAVRELGLEVEIRSVIDPEHLSELHALSLPQLVVNGHHNASKTTMSVSEIKDYLRTFD